jgi:ketosteroid isomerase-like protein
MAHPNEERMRKGYEAFVAGDMAALDQLFTDDVVWHVPGHHSLAGDHEGKQAVLELFAKNMEMTGGTFRLEVHDILANDEHGVALVVATAEREGNRLEDRQVHVLHVREGKVSEFWAHPGDAYAVDEFLS